MRDYPNGVVLVLLFCAGMNGDMSHRRRIGELDESPKRQVRLKVMTFNTWVSGGAVNDGLKKIANHIKKEKIDIVGLQEFNRLHSKTLRSLLNGTWNYGQQMSDVVIFSRYRIMDISNVTLANVKQPTKYTRSEIELASNQTIVVWNAHLDWRNYGPYIACNKKYGHFEKELRQRAVTRGYQAIQMRQEGQFGRDLKEERPMIIMGDFNEPSHLDWLGTTAERHCGKQFRWPVSDYLTSFGFLDAYRQIYPDPVKHPGNTWSPIYSKNTPPASTFEDLQDPSLPEPQDRIDVIYYRQKSSLKPTSCKVYAGSQSLSLVHEPKHWSNDWPSDHASVICNFHL